MILKSSDQVEIQIDNFGYLIIDQHPSTGEEAVVFLSYDQTLALYNFIRKNIKEQGKRWFENNDCTELEWLK